jgi:hypothetical protein
MQNFTAANQSLNPNASIVPTATAPTPINTNTTLQQDQARAMNQGKPGYDVFGDPVKQNYPSSTSTPASEVTTMSSSNISPIVSANTKSINNLNTAVRGQNPDVNNVERYSNGQPAFAPSDATPVLDENGNPTGLWSSNGKNYLVPPTSSTEDPLVTESKNLIARGQASADAMMANTLNSIKAQYDRLIETQKKINAGAEGSLNTLLIKGGSQHTASGDSMSASLASYGLGQLTDLIEKENNAINEATAAYQAGNDKRVDQYLKIAQESRERQQKVAEDVRTQLIDATKRAEERANKIVDEVNKNRNDILTGLDVNAPASVIQAINGAKNVADMVKAAGPYLHQMNGIIGEWMANNRDRVNRGLPEIDFNTYQNIDANRKAKIASAANAAGVSNQSLIRVQAKASQFDNELSVKNYQQSAEAATFLESLDNLGTSTDNIAAVYAFAKIMDPNSVVREGEYKTVQDYAQALFERFGLSAKRVIDNSNFLTSEAIKNMKDTVSKKVGASEKNYKNIYNEYVKQINTIIKLGGGDLNQIKGEDFITDYSKGFSSTANEANKPDEQADQKLQAYTQAHPEKHQDLINAEETLKKTLGVTTISPSVFLQYFPEFQN